MNNVDKKDQETSLDELFKQLEVRYGPGLAQEIVDQIKKTEEQNNKPDFMAVKALSEALEIFRAESKELTKKLKNLRARQAVNDAPNLDIKQLQKDLNEVFKSYWLVQHSFYKAYNRALKVCEVPETYRYDKYTKPAKITMAA